MKFVPAGTHEVLFCIWETRVQDFAAFVQATGYDATKPMASALHDTWRSPGFQQGPTHPVCAVSWEDAKAFCKWLTGKERREGRLASGQTYRLPSDAEWSAAVGLEQEFGSTPAEKAEKLKDVYLWGRQWPLPKRAGNYADMSAKRVFTNWHWPSMKGMEGYDDGHAQTSPVGNFPANEFGLYDMGGNVEEWCQDLFQPGVDWRVLRGASWSSGTQGSLLSSYRLPVLPDRRGNGNGFRCVLSVGAPAPK